MIAFFSINSSLPALEKNAAAWRRGRFSAAPLPHCGLPAAGGCAGDRFPGPSGHPTPWLIVCKDFATA
jgi:hypothetical protein